MRSSSFVCTLQAQIPSLFEFPTYFSTSRKSVSLFPFLLQFELIFLLFDGTHDILLDLPVFTDISPSFSLRLVDETRRLKSGLNFTAKAAMFCKDCIKLGLIYIIYQREKWHMTAWQS